MNYLFSGFGMIWLLISPVSFVGSTQGQNPGQTPKFGGTFDQLDPLQQRLVRDWYAHFNEIMGADLKAEVAYGQLPFSTRTTFEAVTNAAMNTQLTDASGQSLGTALDLVRLIETVRGEVSEARGDVQFRIYAVLVPGAVDVLERSVQFNRGRDNTHYHVDYPVNYRLEGTPSLQFSITDDGRRADIDVDYRSSSFPKLFFDGHLKAANSDVRAWDNYDVHAGRWQGFVNWWRNLFGIPVAGTASAGPPEAGRSIYPPNPRVSDHEHLPVAVEDFLTSWLVRQEPEQAMPYFATASYACIRDVEKDSQTSDMAPLRILRDMKEVNQVLGTIRRLEDGVEAAEPGDTSLKPVENPHAAQFSLARIPPEQVNQLECHDAAESIVLKHDESFKDYFAVGMRLKNPHGTDLFQVWTKQEGYWKIVAFQVEPFAETLPVPDARSSAARRRPSRTEPVTVDPALVARVEEFMDAWLIQRDEAAAASDFSEKAFDCVGLFEDPPRPPGPDPRAGLEQELKTFSDGIGNIPSLETALSAAEPWNPALHRVVHGQQDAYTLTTYPNDLARQQDCRIRREGGAGGGSHSGAEGNFFAVSFQLRNAGESPPILTLVWSKEKKDWEIVSFDVETN